LAGFQDFTGNDAYATLGGSDMVPDMDTRREPAIPSGNFCDFLPYSDFAQAWLEHDVFSAGYGREKNSIAPHSFCDKVE
jgi:hypothetical protein